MNASSNLLIQCLLMTSVLVCPLLAANADEKITYDDNVKPIFQKRCAACHNGDKQSGGLDLSNYTNMMQGGGSGSSIEPGDAGSSYLYLLISHEETPVMPPGGTKIPDEEIRTIESWIGAGALENKGSVAKPKMTAVVSATNAIGVRPDQVAFPPRMSLEPFFNAQQDGMVTSIATSPWASVVALAGTRQVLLYDTEKQNLIGTLPFPEGQANALTFSRNGSLLIAGGGRHGLSGKVVGWDLNTAERVFEIGEEVDNVLAADISPNHSMVALGGPQKMLRVYSTESHQLIYEIKKHTDWITAIEFSPDGVLLATADRSGGLQLWEAESGTEYLTLGGHAKTITSINWRADGNVLASAGNDGAVRLWEVENGKQIKTWATHGPSTTDVCFTRDGRVVTCGRDSLAKLWQQDGKLLQTFEGLNEIGIAVGYCDESKKLIASSLAGAISVWPETDGKNNSTLDSNPPLLSTRIKHAEQDLEAAQSAFDPVNDRRATVESELTLMNDKIAQLETGRDQYTAETAKQQTTIDQLQAEADAGATQRQSWTTEIDKTEQAVPLVAEAKERAVEASNVLPNDQMLKETADKLTTRHSQLVQRIIEAKELIRESQELTEKRSVAIAASNDAIELTQSNLSDTNSQLDDKVAERKPVQDKRNALFVDLNAAERELKQKQQLVKRWLAELEFHEKLIGKRNELDQANEAVGEQSLVLKQAEDSLTVAKAEFDRRIDDKNVLEKSAARIKEQLRDLQTRK